MKTLTFRSKLFQQLDEIFLPYNFKRIKNTYTRVINDVFQTVKIEFIKKTHLNECRISFFTYPMGMLLNEKNLFRDSTLYMLKHLEPENHILEYNGWRYDKQNCDAVVTEIVRFINNYLISFFRESSDSINALQAMQNIETIFDRSRELNNLPALPMHWWNGIFAGVKFYFAIRC